MLRPEGFSLPADVMARARAIAAETGATIEETSDRAAAMSGAHVLYAKSWAAPQAYGRPAEEAKLRAPFKDWCVSESWFAPAARGARFMHCLPVRRNVKVRDEVLDGPRSVVVQEAGNRLHVQKAVLMELLAPEAAW